jgi:hypothetical protein
MEVSMSKKVSASELSSGSWSAEFGAWIIWIRSAGNSWTARVASRRHGGRVLIGKRGVFTSAAEAVEWSCSVLRQHGAVAFVDGGVQPLERFLAFTSAPNVVCS